MAVPSRRRTTVIEAEAWLTRELEGYRGEILYGRLTATPLADGPHQLTLTRLLRAFGNAGAEQAGLMCLLGIGLWLPTGPEDFAVPDLSIVEADFLSTHVQINCYAPHAFRMVSEVTACTWSDDLGLKAACYAEAGIPVYVVVDRRHDEVLLRTRSTAGTPRPSASSAARLSPCPSPSVSLSTSRWTPSSTATDPPLPEGGVSCPCARLRSWEAEGRSVYVLRARQ